MTDRATEYIAATREALARALNSLGLLLRVQGDYAGAVKQYREALKLDPKHKRSLYRQAICLSQLKKFPEAVASWKKYIEATGGEANGYSNLGFCHELAGQIDQAESAYLRGIERESKNVACRTNYGLMLARLGRYRMGPGHEG